MPFPAVDRVIYAKNTLNKVICQLRFPPILKINTEIPAEFQEKIRNDFPNFSQSAQVVYPTGLQDVIPADVMQQVVQKSGNNNFEFSSDDGKWQIDLTHSFIALSTEEYHLWDEFKAKLTEPLRFFGEIYAPGSYSRIGLRYVNIIQRSDLGLEEVAWSDLLQPYISGILDSSVCENVKAYENKSEIILDDNASVVRLMTQFVKKADDDEICYMIDSDFFNNNKMSLDQVLETADYLNKRASRLFQWCVKSRLHEAMEPEPVNE